jgi:S1-C subfamily serine protease
VLVINGSPIDSVQQLRAAILRLRIGDTVRVVVADGSAGARREVKFVLPQLVQPRVTLQNGQDGEVRCWLLAAGC